MMDETLEKLFCELMELPPGDRPAALEAADGLTDGQKSEIRRMLEDAEMADEYFTGTSVAVRMAPKPAAVEGEGDHCGPYKLERKLGEGGFGVVWVARQEKPLRRTVAVKVIKAGMDSEEVLARFDAEKHALARMDHPNIAKVLDAGLTHQGRPYFVMELVEGLSITRYCEEHALGIGDRLRLHADVCAAVNHAHQKGVIHRDIKPSNVLVTRVEGRPVVKVIDFGIAKAIDGDLTDHTLRTRPEQWIGTPAYMSPEQAGLADAVPDTRSDVYALGVLLYELVSGAPPFDSATLLKAGYEEMRRIIREVEPPRPSARIATASHTGGDTRSGKSAPATAPAVKDVSSELDWIIMKAMEKARDRRYDSAAALADDVVRFLADEPVLARPPGRWYLLSKFARRHRLAIHVASAFLLLVVGTALLGIWLALRAYDAEQEARTRLDEVLAERNARMTALQEAEAVANLLAEVLQRPQYDLDGRSATIMSALDAAAEKLETRNAMPVLRLVKLRDILAESYDRLGIHERNVELRMKNFETLRRQHGDGHGTTREVLRKVIEAAEAGGQSGIALEHAMLYRDLVREAGLPPSHMEAAMRSVVRARLSSGDRAGAIEEQRALLEYCSQAFGTESKQEIHAERELRQYEAARDSGAEIRNAENEFANLMDRHGATHDETIEARTRLAAILHEAGFLVEAQMHLQALQAITLQQYGPLDDRTLDALRRLSSLHFRANQYREAVAIRLLLAMALRERDGEMAETVVREENWLISHLSHMGNDLYRTYLKDLLERRIELFGKDHIHTVRLQALAPAGSDEETIANVETAIRVYREHYGEKSRATAGQISGLARLYVGMGRTREAMKYFAECGPNMLDDTWLNFETATFQYWMGDLEGYRITRNNILRYWDNAIQRRGGRAEMFDRAMWLGCISALDADWQRRALERMMEHVDQMRAGLHVEVTERFDIVHQTYIRGAVLFRLGRFGEALEALERAEWQANRGRYEPSETGYTHPPRWARFFMAMAQHHLGNEDEARRLLESGESRLGGDPPCTENPVMQFFVGGEPMTDWILHREARALIAGE